MALPYLVLLWKEIPKARNDKIRAYYNDRREEGGPFVQVEAVVAPGAAQPKPGELWICHEGQSRGTRKTRTKGDMRMVEVEPLEKIELGSIYFKKAGPESDYSGQLRAVLRRKMSHGQIIVILEPLNKDKDSIDEGVQYRCMATRVKRTTPDRVTHVITVESIVRTASLKKKQKVGAV